MARWVGKGSALERAVLHFNVADFAVAVERAEDSGLREKPLIIAPTHAARAVVYDMSEEAYGEGVRKGMALRQATRICRKAEIRPPRLSLYQKAMQPFFKELTHYSPLIECGEADGHFFIDVTGTHRLHGPAPDVGWRVRRNVRRELGVDPIWTLGTNKLISKVASRLVKPVGEYIVMPGEEATFLAPLSITLLPGITRKELERLLEFRLTTIGAVARLSRSQLLVPFGSRCDFLHAASRGVDSSTVSRPKVGDATVDLEHIFADDTNDMEEVEAVVTALGSKAGVVLRRRKQVARRVGVWLRYSDGGHVIRQASCRSGTSGELLLHTLAATALHRAWVRRTRIRSCRLVCDRLRRSSPQLSLFPEPDAEKQESKELLEAMDILRSRYGDNVIGVGKQFQRASSVENSRAVSLH